MSVSTANQKFWNELCGTFLLQKKGIVVEGPQDLEDFDHFYFDFYPYLSPYLDKLNPKGKKILEIGLGFGTVGHYLQKVGADYTGLDIAKGPVEAMQERIEFFKLSGQATQGNALDIPFKAETFDAVVAIGSLHHTGDLARAIQEAHRVLKPKGKALVMVYSRFSYIQWLRWPWQTMKALFEEEGLIAESPEVQESQRFYYDRNSLGDAAPCTELTSTKRAKKLFSNFQQTDIVIENCTSLRFGDTTFIARESLLPWLSRVGLDLYILGTK